jgi:hypothetical protein
MLIKPFILRTIFILVSFLLTTAQAIEPLSSEKKQSSLEKFALTSSKMVLKAKRSSSPEEYVSHGKQGVLNKYTDGASYVIRLMYQKDVYFPTLYGGMIHFDSDQSSEFHKKTTQEIFTHYFGDGYQELKPSLRAVTEVVAIDVRIDTSEQLEKLLEDSRIVLVEHIADHPIETIYQ